MNIYVGNLSYALGEDDIEKVFSSYGAVSSVKLITDRATGRKKGFGFVEMEDEDGNKAIEALNGSELEGRKMVVNEARERSDDDRPRNSDRNNFNRYWLDN